MVSTDLIICRLQVLDDGEALKVDIEMSKSCVIEYWVDLLLAEMLPHLDRSGKFQVNRMWRHLMEGGVVRIM